MSTLSAGRSSLPLLPEARGAGLVPWCRFWLAGQPDKVDVPPRAAKLAPLARRDAADFGAGRQVGAAFGRQKVVAVLCKVLIFCKVLRV
jgi:hypothetical protein